MDFFNQIVVECKDNTKSLFIRHGLEKSLPSSGIPDSLTKYLNEMETKIISYKDDSSLYYRSQLQRINELCSEVPMILYDDINDRYNNEILTEINENRNKYMCYKNESENMKQRILKQLKPNFKSKNLLSELQELMKSEEERVIKDREIISISEKEVINISISLSHNYLSKLLQYYKILMHIYDSLVFDVDLIPLKGDDSLIPTPKGIKKLIRLKEKLDSGKIENFERFREKEWKGVKLSDLKLPENIKTSEIYIEPVIELFSPQIVQTKKTDKTSKANSVSLKNKKGEITQNQMEDISSIVKANVTNIHRKCYKAGNEIFNMFVDSYKNHISGLFNYFDGELKNVEKWSNDWKRIICDLKD